VSGLVEAPRLQRSLVEAPRLRRMEWGVALGVLVFALGMAAAALWGGGRQAWATLMAVPGGVLPAMLALSLLNYALRARRWLLFSAALKLGVPPNLNALYYVTGFAMTTTPGKMGEAIRLWLLNRYNGTSYDRTAALLVADRLLDAVAITAVVAISVFWFAHYVSVAVLAVLLVACVTALCLKPNLLLWGIDTAFARWRRWPRLFVRARRMVRALGSLAPLHVFAPALAMSVIGWGAEGLSFFVLLKSMGVHLHPLACVFIFAFSMLVGAISVLPGGLGSTEATMVGLLASQGVPFHVSIVATAVVRVTTLWFAVALGLLALPVALQRRRTPLASHA
jgi:uncharacterized protein (TIRG00374 family)